MANITKMLLNNILDQYFGNYFFKLFKKNGMASQKQF